MRWDRVKIGNEWIKETYGRPLKKSMYYALLYILLNFLLTEWQLIQWYSVPLPLLPALTRIRNPLA